MKPLQWDDFDRGLLITVLEGAMAGGGTDPWTGRDIPPQEDRRFNGRVFLVLAWSPPYVACVDLTDFERMSIDTRLFTPCRCSVEYAKALYPKAFEATPAVTKKPEAGYHSQYGFLNVAQMQQAILGMQFGSQTAPQASFPTTFSPGDLLGEIQKFHQAEIDRRKARSEELRRQAEEERRKRDGN